MALNYEAFFVIKRFFCEVTRVYCSFKIRPVPVGDPVHKITDMTAISLIALFN
jgi:hypothetical protein